MISSVSALDTCARAGVEYFIYRYPPRRQGSFPITVQNKSQQQAASRLQRVLTVSASQGLTRRYGQAKRKSGGRRDTRQRVADRGFDIRLRKMGGAATGSYLTGGLRPYAPRSSYAFHIEPYIQGTRTGREPANHLKTQRGNYYNPNSSINPVLSTSIRLPMSKTGF